MTDETTDSPVFAGNSAENAQVSEAPDAAQSARIAPRVDKVAWTYDLTGDCVYCGKKCKRSRTFYAKSQNDAAAQADAAMGGLCHRKCGGY